MVLCQVIFTFPKLHVAQAYLEVKINGYFPSTWKNNNNPFLSVLELIVDVWWNNNEDCYFLIISLSLALSIGKSRSIAFQTASKSMPKYSWIRMFHIAIICAQGIAEWVS